MEAHPFSLGGEAHRRGSLPCLQRATSLAVVPTFTSSLTSNNILTLPKPLFPHLENGNNHSHLSELPWVEVRSFCHRSQELLISFTKTLRLFHL